MSIEQQVLSIEQVRELQELGFDIKKHSSMYYVPNWITKFGVDEIQDYLLQIGGLGEDDDGDCIPTLTIGDIIEILPYELRPDELFSLEKQNIYFHIYYLNWEGAYIFNITNKSLINALFETLKWCIKEKHIKLKK